MPSALFTTSDDKTLFLLIADGDEAAFAALFNRYAPRLHSFLSRLAGSDAAGEELVQNTFIRVWIGRDKLPDIESPRAWIYRVAANEAYTWLQRQTREERKLQQLSVSAGAQLPAGDDVLYRELKQAIAIAVQSLPERRRQIYRLHREQGLLQQEIADQLGISLRTVKATLAEATADIRRHLIQKGLLALAVLIGCPWR